MIDGFETQYRQFKQANFKRWIVHRINGVSEDKNHSKVLFGLIGAMVGLISGIYNCLYGEVVHRSKT